MAPWPMTPAFSDELVLLGKEEAAHNDGGNDAEDAKEPLEAAAVAAGHGHVHAKQAADEVQRHEDRRNERDLAQHVVGVVALLDALHRDLRQVVRVRARQHLLKVAQVRLHRHHVVLHVAQVQANLGARRHWVLLVAALGEALDHVGLAAQQAHQAHDLAPALANLAQQRARVVGARHEHLVLDHVRLALNVVDRGPKGVDNVIAVHLLVSNL